MKKLSCLAAAALLAGSTAIAASNPASAAPLTRDSGLSDAATSQVTDVQFRGRGWRGGHRGYGYRGGYYRRGTGTGAIIGGLAAGAIIGGAIAAGQANAAAQQNAGYCAQRYRSYDPASGTYLNNDGNRYPCP